MIYTFWTLKEKMMSTYKKKFHENFDDDYEIDEEEGEDGDAESADHTPTEITPVKTKTLTRREALEILETTKDFSGLDFRKANLSKLDFSNCNFRNANLSYTNFKDCNLEGSDFRTASLWNANLEGANLARAHLEDADLDYTKLRGACFYRAHIKRATLPVDLIPREEILRSVNEGSKITR